MISIWLSWSCWISGPLKNCEILIQTRAPLVPTQGEKTFNRHLTVQIKISNSFYRVNQTDVTILEYKT